MLHTKTCKHCGRQFETRHGRTKYCGSECYVAKERERNRARTRTEAGRIRARAHSAVAVAILTGKLVRQPCEVCGKPPHRRDIHAHHDDYRKPLEVRWLCVPHHRQHHAKHGTAPG